jgi:hypothetical protein
LKSSRRMRKTAAAAVPRQRVDIQADGAMAVRAMREVAERHAVHVRAVDVADACVACRCPVPGRQRDSGEEGQPDGEHDEVERVQR